MVLLYPRLVIQLCTTTFCGTAVEIQSPSSICMLKHPNRRGYCIKILFKYKCEQYCDNKRIFFQIYSFYCL